MREQTFFKYTLQVANVYEETAAKLAEDENRPYQKTYNNLSKMLEECYFVGASKFGHNFIA